METHLTQPLQTHSSLLNSFNSPQTLSGSTSNLLERTFSSSDFDDGSSPLSEGTLPNNDPSDCDSFPGDTDSKDGENEDYDLTVRSPLYTSSSHWAGPWNSFDSRPTWHPWSFGGMEDSGASEDSALIDWDSRTELEIKPSFSALITEQKSYNMGAGLANLGNTCFLNVILQCFTYTVPLLQGLLVRTHKVPCECYCEGFCVFCNLFEHIEWSLSNSGGVVSPSKFVNNLNYFSSSFRRFQQEDAHEFLQCFLDKLESCGNDFKHAESDSIVKKVFGGRLVSKLRCCNCGHCSDTYEPLIDLSLEIDEVSSLSTALESFTKVEKIEDPETKFTCENCKEQVSVEKQLMLDQAPSVATFHLKRFKNHGSFVEKIDNHVDFPLELDLLPYTDGNQSNKSRRLFWFLVGQTLELANSEQSNISNPSQQVEMKYDLFAVVVHTGFSSTSGHYYCFIRAAPNEWYKFDDSKVFLAKQEHVLEQEAYILFYAKQGTPCFSSFIETHKQRMDQSLLNNSPKSVLDTVDGCTTSPLPLNCHFDVKETSDIVEAACIESPSGSRDGEETLPGGRDCTVVNDSDEKEDSISPLPLVSGNPADVASCEINESTSISAVNNSSDVPSCEACKSGSLLVVDGIADVPSCEACKSTSPPVPKESNFAQERFELGNSADVVPTVPSRSPSPEIYREVPPDISFSIPRGHLRLMDRVSCKRQLSKDLEDLGRKQACTFVKKNVPGSRGKQLMEAICGPLSEGSVNKKRSRGMHTSPSSDDRNSASRRRGGIPVLAFR